VHVIWGFLGSGKTTFLQALLAHMATQDFSPAVLINDYGAINIDAELLRGQGAAVRAFTDGCICCTLRPDLVLALRGVLADQPDVICIETTGLADPLQLLDQLTRPELLPLIRVASLTAVIDPRSSARRTAAEGYHFQRQLKMADFVLINKQDTASPAEMSALETQVRHDNPRATVVCTQHGQMDFSQIVGHQGDVLHVPDMDTPAPPHAHFHSYTYVCPGPLVPEQFVTLIQSLPQTIWRAKGFVRFTNPAKQWLFHYDGEEVGIGEVSLWPQPPDHLVFIGHGFEHEALAAALIKCHLPKARPERESVNRSGKEKNPGIEKS
jgi:G3E family GTPase